MSVRWRVPVCAAVLGGVLVAAGCADFTAQPQDWRPQDELTPQAGPQPHAPGEPSPRPSTPPSEVPPPNGCTDYDPAVIGTCLDAGYAVAALPGDGAEPTALVGERKSGRILRVKQGLPAEVVATIPVDASGDGGLTGLALSPTYAEDQLIFAYVTTPEDNRLVRIAPGDNPKPIITGIPKGASGNRGSLSTDRTGALLLATGDTGNPAAANDQASLAGKLLRVDPAGQPAQGNPSGSAIVASGLASPGGVCTTLDGTATWITDRTPTVDLLYRFQLGKPLGAAAWRWTDRPGVAGCVALPTAVWVATSTAGNVQSLALAEDGTFRDKPQVGLEDKNGYGMIGGFDLINEQFAVFATVNKDGGQPVSSDDRAVVLPLTGGSQSGGPD
jgi:glucose/arabinose dehydrogenase